MHQTGAVKGTDRTGEAMIFKGKEGQSELKNHTHLYSSSARLLLVKLLEPKIKPSSLQK